MPYNPGVSNIGGQLLAQGIAQAGQNLARGIERGIERYAQNKQHDSALTSIIEGYGPKLQSLAPTLSPEGQKMAEKFLNGKATLLDKTTLAGALQTADRIQGQDLQRQLQQAQLRQAASQQQQAEREQAAQANADRYLQQAAQYQQGGAGSGVLTPDALAKYNSPMARSAVDMQRLTGSVSPQILAQLESTRIAAESREAAQRPPLKYRQDEGGKTYEITEFADGRAPAKGTVMQPPRPVLTPEEEAQKHQMILRTTSANKFNEGVLEAGQAAVNDLRNFEIALKHLDTVRTGTGASFQTSVQRLGEAIGFTPPGTVANADQLQSLLGDAIMQRVQQTKGSVSDKEMAIFDTYSASMNKTPEGNRAILSGLRNKAARDRELGQLALKLRRDGKAETEIQNAINDAVLNRPIFDPGAEAAIGGAALELKDIRSRIEELRRKQGL